MTDAEQQSLREKILLRETILKYLYFALAEVEENRIIDAYDTLKYIIRQIDEARTK
jgi:hypothetical protein